MKETGRAEGGQKGKGEREGRGWRKGREKEGREKSEGKGGMGMDPTKFRRKSTPLLQRHGHKGPQHFYLHAIQRLCEE